MNSRMETERMNQEERRASKLTAFTSAYFVGLLAAIEADQVKPSEKREYHYGPEGVEIVVDKMMRAIASNPNSVNYGGNGFRLTCKLLGIKHTRKAIFAFLEIGT